MSAVAEIKEKCNIYDYIGRYVNLKQRGAGEFIGICPFHQEKTPSFCVSQNKDFFHCFGCKESGDIFTFAMKQHGLTYHDALKKLAEEFGVSLQQGGGSFHKEDAMNREIGETIANFYNKTLLSDKSSRQFQYLTKRGLNLDTIKEYKLGFASSDSRVLVDELVKKFGVNFLVKNKWFNIKKNYKNEVEVSNPFYGRIIFPIWNGQGSVVGFGGRVIDDSFSKVKYINSPDSNIFHKSEIFYGMHNLKAREEALVVVEGYMDVLALHQAGVKNVVAPLGTGIKMSQIEKLWRYNKKPIFCFDGDRAGQESMLRVAKMALPELTPDKNISFYIMQEGQDPDSAVREGDTFCQDIKDKAIGILDFIFHRKVHDKKPSKITPEDKAMLRSYLKNLALSVKHNALAQEYKFTFEKMYWSWVKGGNKDKPAAQSASYGKSYIMGFIQNNKATNTKYMDKLAHIFVVYSSLFDDEDICDEMDRWSDERIAYISNAMSDAKDKKSDSSAFNKESENLKQIGSAEAKNRALKIISIMKIEDLAIQSRNIENELNDLLKKGGDEENLLLLEKKLINLKSEEAKIRNTLPL